MFWFGNTILSSNHLQLIFLHCFGGHHDFVYCSGHMFQSLLQRCPLNLEGLEHIAAFMQRMAERPEVQDALSAEGLK